jgi:hypothetical protein
MNFEKKRSKSFPTLSLITSLAIVIPLLIKCSNSQSDASLSAAEQVMTTFPDNVCY